MSHPSQGEIYFADPVYDPLKHRLIVVSREALNRGSYVTVVPVTSSRFAERSKLANCVVFRGGEYGFTKDCVAQTEQIVTIPKANLDIQSGAIATLRVDRLQQIVRAIGNVIGADCAMRA